MIPVALSPCPNDTFLFHAWLKGLVGKSLVPKPTFGDIEQLNRWAVQGHFPLTKLSFATFAQVTDRYQLLPIGSALGNHAGPKIIAKEPFDLAEIPSKRIAIPGQATSAHLLFKSLSPPAREKLFCTYDQIFKLLDEDAADCGIIIHESRFTFKKRGFYEIADLGDLWEKRYRLPLPLGGLAIQRTLPRSTQRAILSALKDSLIYARAHPEASQGFVQFHAQESDPKVIDDHIQLYVNPETAHLTSTGISAIKTLLHCAEKFANVKLIEPWMYDEAISFCHKE